MRIRVNTYMYTCTYKKCIHTYICMYAYTATPRSFQMYCTGLNSSRYHGPMLRVKLECQIPQIFLKLILVISCNYSGLCICLASDVLEGPKNPQYRGVRCRRARGSAGRGGLEDVWPRDLSMSHGQNSAEGDYQGIIQGPR